MTGAHLGGRGACRRRSCSATAAPREGGRRRGHRDGRHHPRPQRGFFSSNSDRRVTLSSVTKIMPMDHPHRFLSGPSCAMRTAHTQRGASQRRAPAAPPRRLALVQHRNLAERGLLSFLRLLSAFLLNAIKRNQPAGKGLVPYIR